MISGSDRPSPSRPTPRSGPGAFRTSRKDGDRRPEGNPVAGAASPARRPAFGIGRPRTVRFLPVVLVFLIAACARVPEAPHKPVVAVSVLPQAAFVEGIAGDLVAVQVMIPPGAAEMYEPNMEQLRSLSRAVLYVKVGHPGFPFEAAWLDDLLAENPGLPVVDASEGVDRKAGDPHVWVSPQCVRVMARNIAAALVERFPEDGERFRTGLEEFLLEVDEVDRDLRRMLGPFRGREILVFHPAWGYLAEEYGLVQVAVEHGHKEPGAKQLADLIKHARETGTRVIFAQPQVSRAHAEALAAEIGAEVVIVDPLARDWAENLRRTGEAFRRALGEE